MHCATIKTTSTVHPSCCLVIPKKYIWRNSSIFNPVYRSLIIYNNKTKELSQRDKISKQSDITKNDGWVMWRQFIAFTLSAIGSPFQHLNLRLFTHQSANDISVQNLVMTPIQCYLRPHHQVYLPPRITVQKVVDNKHTNHRHQWF